MRRFAFWKLDAFTDGTSPGNPAALVRLAPEEVVTDAEMQRIAAELGNFVSEVVFARSHGAELELRFFSREREVAFCGHATVATLHHLFSTDPAFQLRSRVTIITATGRLAAENRIAHDGCVYVAAPPLVFSEPEVRLAEAAAALGLPETALDRSGLGSEGRLPIAECGLRALLVPLTGLTPLLACAPDFARLRAFSDRAGAEIVVAFSSEVELPGRDLRTRVFAPRFGYLEDPATGSGNAALAGWLRRTGAWTSSTLAIEQGPSRANPNLVTIRTNDSGGLQIGGRGIVRIAGSYLLH